VCTYHLHLSMVERECSRISNVVENINRVCVLLNVGKNINRHSQENHSNSNAPIHTQILRILTQVRYDNTESERCVDSKSDLERD